MTPLNGKVKSPLPFFDARIFKSCHIYISLIAVACSEANLKRNKLCFFQLMVFCHPSFVARLSVPVDSCDMAFFYGPELK